MAEKKFALVSFSLRGGRLAERMAEILRQRGCEGETCAMKRYADQLGQAPVEPDLSTWCGERWNTTDIMVFVGASGIAVRTIAPYVKSKTSDPAVLVADEGGHFVISLLSGHLGGANAWTDTLAEALGAVPVITTATDVNRRFAVDVWAQGNDLLLTDMKAAKEISAAVLRGERIPVFHDGRDFTGPVPPELEIQPPFDLNRQELPEALMQCTREKPGILITPRISGGWQDTAVLQLIPRTVTLGIGCRRDKDPEELKSTVYHFLAEAGIDPRSVCRICSIDLKKEEAGICSLAEEWKVPFTTYSGEELRQVPGDITPSAFVTEVTGVDNVCERAALMGAGPGARLIMKKCAGSGVTTAAALGHRRIEF